MIAHHFFGIDPRAIDSLGADAGCVVGEPVNDLASQMGHPDGVSIWKCDDDANIGMLPVAFVDELVDFAADVLTGLTHPGQQLAAHACPQIPLFSCRRFAHGYGNMLSQPGKVRNQG